MLGRYLENIFGGKPGVFFVVFLGVTLVLVGASYWVITYVYAQVQVEEEGTAMSEELSPIYVDYYLDPEQYISGESYVAMAEYAQQYPEPRNAQVLTGLTTNEINGYMINHFVGGMGVNCTYCHNINNFAADVWDDEEAMQNKTTARQHLLMTQALNRDWLGERLVNLTEDKQPSGSQVTCATCHNGVAQPVTWDDVLVTLPNSFRLPLDEDTVFSVDEQGLLNVNARRDVSLDTVQYNQYVMYHMNTSMNVGCTHCHNSRYFPSYEVPAKYYALHMLQMSQYIQQEWGHTFNGKDVSCTMCHQEAVIPPGSARSADILPAVLVAPQD